VYYVSARGALLFAFEHTNVTPVWPPSGIAVAILLLFGLEYWPVFLVSSFLVNITTGQSSEVSSIFAVGNTYEYVFAAWFLRSRRFQGSLRRLRDIVLLAIPGAFMSSLIAATIGVVGLWVGGDIVRADVPFVWRTYVLGDSMGILVFTPFIMVWRDALRSSFPSKRAIAELTLLESLVIGFSALIFLSASHHQPYLMFPLVIWAAVRFGQQGATLNTLLISVLALCGTVHGLGPFTQGSVIDRLTDLQLYIVALAMTALSLAAAALRVNET
jgi:integral membrane sensor domain MASE1